MPRVIGRERMNPPNRTKAKMAGGYTPIFTARKAIKATQLIGMVGLANQFAESHSMRNGSASQRTCLADRSSKIDPYQTQVLSVKPNSLARPFGIPRNLNSSRIKRLICGK
jgi:hypothetical protein